MKYVAEFITLGFRSAAILAIALGAMNSQARAEVTVLCPGGNVSPATQGGFGSDTYTPFAGSQDGVCGANSGETLAINPDTDYAKLEWNPPQFSSGLTLGDLPGVGALVSFNSQQADGPYFILGFTDPSGSVGQSNDADQILLIENQNNSGINGAGFVTFGIDPTATRFDLYDNTTNQYLEGGQSDTNTLDGWLALDPSLASDSIGEIGLAIGLDGSGCGTHCAESLAVDSAEVTPEPGTTALMIAGLAAVLLLCRRKSKSAPVGTIG